MNKSNLVPSLSVSVSSDDNFKNIFYYYSSAWLYIESSL